MRVKTVEQVKKYIQCKVMKYWDTFFVIGKSRLLHNIAYNTGYVIAKYSSLYSKCYWVVQVNPH